MSPNIRILVGAGLAALAVGSWPAAAATRFVSPAGAHVSPFASWAEAATNIQRHARARHAQVRFGMEAGEAVLRVEDDGRGGALVPGNGLSGMRERIEAVRGRLRVDAGAGQGTRIEARVPLAANDDLPAAS